MRQVKESKLRRERRAKVHGNQESLLHVGDNHATALRGVKRVSCSNSDDEQEPEDDAGSPSDLQNQGLNEDDADADEPPIEDGMHLPCSSMS